LTDTKTELTETQNKLTTQKQEIRPALDLLLKKQLKEQQQLLDKLQEEKKKLSLVDQPRYELDQYLQKFNEHCTKQQYIQKKHWEKHLLKAAPMIWTLWEQQQFEQHELVWQQLEDEAQELWIHMEKQHKRCLYRDELERLWKNWLRRLQQDLKWKHFLEHDALKY